MPNTADPSEMSDSDYANAFSPENMAREMNVAFPGSAPPPETSAPSPAPALPPAAPSSPAAEPPREPPPTSTAPPAATVPEPSILPEEIFGEKTEKTPTVTPPVEDDLSKKEYDAPENIKKDAKQYQNWNELHRSEERGKRTAAELQKKVDELTSKLGSYKTDEGLKARVEQLEAENNDFRTRQDSIDLQSREDYQKVFVHGRRRKVQEGSEILKEAGIDPADFEKAMDMTGGSRRQAIEEIFAGINSDLVKSELGVIVRDVNSLDRSKEQTLADAKGNLQKLRELDKANQFKAIQQHEKYLDDTMDAVVSKLRDLKFGFLTTVEGNDSWNKGVEERIATARDIVKNSRDFPTLVRKVLLGENAGVMYDSLLALNKRLKEVLAENAALRASEPSFNGTRKTADSTPGDGSALPKELTFAEAAAARSGLR